jgi:hypothetical protein
VTEAELRALIPKGEHDTERAEKLVALGYPAVAPIVPELIEWLRDGNWPVARILGPFLQTIGLPLVPEIRRVFATDDYGWQYFLLVFLVNTPEMVAALRAELTRLAEHPTPREAEEALDELAQECLEEG